VVFQTRGKHFGLAASNRVAAAEPRLILNRKTNSVRKSVRFGIHNAHIAVLSNTLKNEEL
jgi:hypothetical protein